MFFSFQTFALLQNKKSGKTRKKRWQRKFIQSRSWKARLSCRKRMWLLVEIVELFISLLVMHQEERCIILEISLLLVHNPRYRKFEVFGLGNYHHVVHFMKPKPIWFLLGICWFNNHNQIFEKSELSHCLERTKGWEGHATKKPWHKFLGNC
mgnify:CR=1 FL=1